MTPGQMGSGPVVPSKKETTEFEITLEEISRGRPEEIMENIWRYIGVDNLRPGGGPSVEQCKKMEEIVLKMKSVGATPVDFAQISRRFLMEIDNDQPSSAIDKAFSARRAGDLISMWTLALLKLSE